jgi:hypothetical protein
MFEVSASARENQVFIRYIRYNHFIRLILACGNGSLA